MANPAVPTAVVSTVERDTTTFDLILRQADVLAQSTIIPSNYRKRPHDIVAAGLGGRAYGWDVMTSLRQFHVIEGTASLRPEAMLGLVRQAGHSVTVETDPGIAVAHGTRADTGDQHSASFTITDAQAAGLAGKKNWQQYEEAMLTWRAVAKLCRVLFPDVVLGAGYVPEELGAEVTEKGEIVEVDATAVGPVDAKNELVAACGDNVDLAKNLWGDRGSAEIDRAILDTLVEEGTEKTRIEAERVAHEQRPFFETDDEPNGDISDGG